MSDPGKAVFLSYAPEDAAATRTICDALRAAGIEVWFDQSELVGGDAWDQKLRRQIKECALFIPLISARTEERREGYFRLEWDLAEERTHLMARGVPFLLPVVIEATREGRAAVPEGFREVQWFRLGGGTPTPEFVARVTRLLSQPRRAFVAPETARAALPAIHPNVTADGPAHYDSLPPRRAAATESRSWIIAGVAGLAAVLVIVAIALRRSERESRNAANPASPAPAATLK